MKTTLIGTAVIAALSLYALPAHAGCADPRGGAHQFVPMILKKQTFRPHEGIVGTWLVTYSLPDDTTVTGQAFIQWHGDGTEWENINYNVLDGNICMGSWESKGPRTYYRNHYGWLLDGMGNYIGSFNETETDTLSQDGNSYTGTNATSFFDSNGNPWVAPPFPPSPSYGKSSATRILP